MKLLPLSKANAVGIKMLIIKILFTGKKEPNVFLKKSHSRRHFWVQSMNGELVFDDKPFAGGQRGWVEDEKQ
jgi:hypothetical protein